MCRIMASAFWHAKGILLDDYMQKGKTINSEYYCSLLDQLDEKIRERTLVGSTKNSLAYKGILSMTKFYELK